MISWEGRTMAIDLSIGSDEGSGPVHETSAPTTAWSTVNVSEAIPGVMTPLTWTFWQPAMERAGRRAYYAVGILNRSMRGASTDPNERMNAVFFGRSAINVDACRAIADLTPGSSGDEL